MCCYNNRPLGFIWKTFTRFIGCQSLLFFVTYIWESRQAILFAIVCIFRIIYYIFIYIILYFNIFLLLLSQWILFFDRALNSRLRTATLRRHSDSQAVLINCLLRIYLQEKQYQAAAKLVSKVENLRFLIFTCLSYFLFFKKNLFYFRFMFKILNTY